MSSRRHPVAGDRFSLDGHAATYTGRNLDGEYHLVFDEGGEHWAIPDELDKPLEPAADLVVTLAAAAMQAAACTIRNETPVTIGDYLAAWVPGFNLSPAASENGDE